MAASARVVVLHVEGTSTRALDIERFAADAWLAHVETREPPAWRSAGDGAVLILSLHEARTALAAWQRAMTDDERGAFATVATALADAIAWAGREAYYTGWVIVTG